MFPFFGWVAWLATATSVVMIVMLAVAGELRVRPGAIAVVWFAIAAYAQFFSRSAIGTAAGLALQTLLAVWLLAWWRLGD